MCGRFSLTHSASAIAKAFQLTEVPSLIPHYNIAPSQQVAAIAAGENGEKRLQSMKWGLIPSWAKDLKIGSKLINARSETLGEKPSFRSAFKRRRCLIVADGFYEWCRQGKDKQPYYIHLNNRELFAFAGLWERWQPEGEEAVISCTIVTTEANHLMAAIHHRMPVILSPDSYDRWLDADLTETSELQSLLTPYPSDRMEAYPVSKVVNSPANDRAECIEKLS